MSVSYGGESITFADNSTISSGWNEFKNRIINGAMVIDQRRAGSSVVANSTNQYVVTSVDRFFHVSSSGGQLTLQQVQKANSAASNYDSSAAPSGFSHSLKVTVSTADTTAGTTYHLRHRLEGYNVSDLAWGTSEAQNATLSFWVKSSVAGKFSVNFFNLNHDYAYVSTYTINNTNTWEYKTITVPAATGTPSTPFFRDNQCGIQIAWMLCNTGTVATPNVWGAASGMVTTGDATIMGTTGATFYLTGVQFERGSTASSFENRSYGTELQLCQRYYCKSYEQWVVPGSTGQTTTAIGRSTDATSSYTTIAQWSYPVTMRTIPSVTPYNPSNGSTSTFLGDSTNFSSPQILKSSSSAVTINAANVSVGQSVYVAVHIVSSAEL